MLKLISKLYEKIIVHRSYDYISGKRKSFHCSVPVISIGNISVGGTGKTPFTIMLASELKKIGIKSAIIGRGYKKKRKGIIVVCDGNKILSDPVSAGDEMILIAEKTMLPVIACEKKYLAAEFTQNNFHIDLILIDDGFQHLQLKRDLDIVIISQNDLENPYLIPYGRLREPLSSLHRADIICSNFDIAKYQNIKNHIESKIIINYKKVSAPPCLFNNKEIQEPDLNIADKFLSISGIANPHRFLNSLNELNIKIEESIIYKDHKNYKENDIYYIIKIMKQKNISNLITTEKDAVKIQQFINIFQENSIRWYVLPLEIVLDNENHSKLFDFINQKLSSM
jgi:tetraacyldisaccharide 4'-kinase